MREVTSLTEGGTLAVLLGNHALARGYQVKLYTQNLMTFDPTWFMPGAPPLDAALRKQMRAKKKQKKLCLATKAYLKFLRMGGEIQMTDFTDKLVRDHLKKKQPVLTGLSATYLYRSPRECGEPLRYNSYKGVPQGHFVVVLGYDMKRRLATIADPLNPNPIKDTVQYYLAGNAFRDDDRIDVDLDGTVDNVYPARFFDYPIADLKVLMPDSLEDGVSPFSFVQSDLPFLFSGVSSTVFERFKKFINIQKKENEIYAPDSLSWSRDYDGDGIKDITLSGSGSQISITAASGKLIRAQSVLLPAAVSTINLSGASSSVTTSSPAPDFLWKFYGFTTSTGKYGIVQISRNYMYYKLTVFINANGNNSFWGRSLTARFDIYGKNISDPNYLYYNEDLETFTLSALACLIILTRIS